MSRVSLVLARGRSLEVRLARGSVTLDPRWWVRLIHPRSARRTQFPAQAASLVHRRPRRGAWTGWVMFDLDEADEQGQDSYLVKFWRWRRAEFATLAQAGNWQEVLRA